jgi:DUF4097 and DUF4098 domain-containing protein YvlB
MKTTSHKILGKNTPVLILVLTSILIMTGCKIRFGSDGPSLTEKTTPDFAGMQTLEVSSFNGDIKITKAENTDTQNASMTVVKRGKVEIKLERDGDTVRIKAESERNCINCSADITLEVPQALNLKLETGNGDVNATDTLNVQAESGNGNVTLEQVAPGAGSENSASSGNGDVTIAGLNATDGLEISGSTGNGSSEFKATGFEVQTEDNDFTAKKPGGNPATFKLESGNGDVTVNP